MNKQKIIITGKNYAFILGMARSLKDENTEIIVLNTKKEKKNNFISIIKKTLQGPSIDSKSNCIDKYIITGNSEEKIIKTLINNYSKLDKKAIIIPLDDYTLSIFDSNYDQLSKDFILPSINKKQGEIVKLLNKNMQKEIAKKNDLFVSDGVLLKKEGKEYININKVKYPVFTKPEISVKGNKTFMKKCDNKEELLQLLESIPKNFNCPIIAEDYLSIEKEYAVVGYRLNEKVFIPGIIEMSKSGSGSQKGVTMIGIIHSPKNYESLINKLTNYVNTINYNGLFDFDIVEVNNKYYFSEMNLRFGASGYAFTKIGINIPKLYCANILNNEINDSIENDNYEKSFVNEKVLLDEYKNGYIGYKECIDYLKNTDYGFIRDQHDKKPFIHFKKQLMIQRLKKIIDLNK